MKILSESGKYIFFLSLIDLQLFVLAGLLYVIPAPGSIIIIMIVLNITMRSSESRLHVASQDIDNKEGIEDMLL